MSTFFIISISLYILTAIISTVILIDLDEYIYLNLRDEKKSSIIRIRYSKELIRESSKFRKYLWMSFIPVLNIFIICKILIFAYSIKKEENIRISKKIIAVGKSPIAGAIRKIKKSCRNL